MNLLKHAFAALIGIMIGLLAVSIGDAISTVLHPTPDPFDVNDYQQVQQHIQSAPMTVQLLMVFVWAFAVGASAYTGRRLAPERLVRPGLLAAVLIEAGVIANLILISHPQLMVILGLTLTVLAIPVGIVLAAPKSHWISISQQIDAPIETVFHTISTVEGFRAAVPHITDVQFLSQQTTGVGTRFRETRVRKGKEASATLEITELQPLEKVRMLSTEGGIVWDSLFEVHQEDKQTQLNLTMECRPLNVPGHLLLPMILNLIKTAMQEDMQSVKQWCESTPAKSDQLGDLQAE